MLRSIWKWWFRRKEEKRQLKMLDQIEMRLINGGVPEEDRPYLRVKIFDQMIKRELDKKK